MHVTKCKLCHKLRPLISRSHIIPDFLYRPLYDEKHRLGLATLFETKADFALRQTGTVEAGLFCADCDNRRLGSLEKYVAENIYRPLEKRAGSAVFTDDEHLLPHRLQVDYAKTKLFFL